MIPAILITTAFWCVAVIAVRVLITSHRAALKAKPEPDAVDAMLGALAAETKLLVEEVEAHPYRIMGTVDAPPPSPADIAALVTAQAQAEQIRAAEHHLGDAYQAARTCIDRAAGQGHYCTMVNAHDMAAADLPPTAFHRLRDAVMKLLIADKFHVEYTDKSLVIKWGDWEGKMHELKSVLATYKAKP